MTAEVSVEDVDPSEYDGVVVPRGPAPDRTRHEDGVSELVQHFFEEETPVAVTCHGLLLPARADVLDGQSLPCWPTVGTEVERAGGDYRDETGVVDESLVSGPLWAESRPSMESDTELLA